MWNLYRVSRISVRWFSRYYRGSYMYRVNERRVCALLQQLETTSPIFSPTRRRSRTCSVIAQCGTEAAVSGSRRRLATWRPTASDTRYVGQTMCSDCAHLFSSSISNAPLRPNISRDYRTLSKFKWNEKAAEFLIPNMDLLRYVSRKKNCYLVLLVYRKAFLCG